jgi:thiosulfate/3-mercaptopyruvate sulfurtransferase
MLKKIHEVVRKCAPPFRDLIVGVSIVCSAFNVSAQRSADVDAGISRTAKPGTTAAQSSATVAPKLIQPEELTNILKSTTGPKPLILQVGFRILYVQAHIPGAEYIGPASKAQGVEHLRERVQDLPRAQFIVLYCGCCPWSKCPNINSAHEELRAMGFRNVKLLYIADNFGKDWLDKGYPVAKGE